MYLSLIVKTMFGLSKVERPILDHHTKAHNLKSGGFHVKSKDLLQGIITLCFHRCTKLRSSNLVVRFFLDILNLEISFISSVVGHLFSKAQRKRYIGGVQWNWHLPISSCEVPTLWNVNDILPS